ncbi:hypothetical protein LCGC14_0702090 [marine sediment metagenome]|uniref:Uncharacterized protein n=1 Tax=marine sediment metagenome TaxID=412755 RepID=A0A0F9R2Y5_9ZZZZ
MKVLSRFESFDGDDNFMGEKLEVEFSLHIGTATISVKRIEQGSGKGKLRAFAHAAHRVWMSAETFDDECLAMEKSIEAAKTMLPKILLSLVVPTKTARLINLARIFNG